MIKFHPGSQIDPQNDDPGVLTTGAQFTPAGVLRVPLPPQQETAVVLESPRGYSRCSGVGRDRIPRAGS